MTPLYIEVSGSTWIDRSLEPEEVLYRPLGGAECLRVACLVDDEDASNGVEIYEISHVSLANTEGPKFQNVLVGEKQKSAHFWVGDTLVSSSVYESDVIE
jgi:hypothetical protein